MENLRGIILMTGSMACFATADMFIKMIAGHVPVAMILFVLGLGGSLIFGISAHLKGEKVVGRDAVSGLMLLRATGEMIGTFGFVTALWLTPISSASAILQATPLAVTLGAALFMGEQVGWRRWSAIIVGFSGVLVVIRPGLDGFQPASLFALMAVVGLTIRDLATRAAPRGMSPIRLGTYGFLPLIPAGLLVAGLTGQRFVLPGGFEWTALALALFADVAGYYALTFAMRMGDVAVITPFRYSRIVFAALFGMIVFAERLDAATIVGAAIIIGSGLYTFARERRRKAAPVAPSP